MSDTPERLFQIAKGDKLPFQPVGANVSTKPSNSPVRQPFGSSKCCRLIKRAEYLFMNKCTLYGVVATTVA